MITILDIIEEWHRDDNPHAVANGGEFETRDRCLEFELIQWNGRPRFVPSEATIFSRINRSDIDPAHPKFFSSDELLSRADPERGRCFMYRGQSKLYSTCHSSLFRNQPESEWHFKALLTLERFQVAELELVMQSHPFSDVARKHGFWVDFHGLAQHYGIPTSLLDLTTDMHVAAFFAVAVWSAEKNQYVPAVNGDGTIYRYDWNKVGTKYFDPVGFGPGLRPARQHAWTFRLHPQLDFSSVPHVENRIFRHDEAASLAIFEMFDNGEYLLPPDCLEKTVKKVKALPFVTMGAIRHAARQDGCADNQIPEFAERAARMLNEVLGIDFVDGYRLELEQEDLIEAHAQANFLSEEIHKISKGWRLVRSAE